MMVFRLIADKPLTKVAILLAKYLIKRFRLVSAMKVLFFLIFLVIGSAFAGEESVSPFASVKVDGQVIVATLLKDQRWLVKIDAEEPRLSKYGETFRLKGGVSLTMVEKHSSFEMYSQDEPRPGLKVIHTFDASSFGGGISKKSYFIAAAK